MIVALLGVGTTAKAGEWRAGDVVEVAIYCTTEEAIDHVAKEDKASQQRLSAVLQHYTLTGECISVFDLVMTPMGWMPTSPPATAMLKKHRYDYEDHTGTVFQVWEIRLEEGGDVFILIRAGVGPHDASWKV